jgi:hypothetical protein
MYTRQSGLLTPRLILFILFTFYIDDLFVNKFCFLLFAWL